MGFYIFNLYVKQGIGMSSFWILFIRFHQQIMRTSGQHILHHFPLYTVQVLRRSMLVITKVHLLKLSNHLWWATPHPTS